MGRQMVLLATLMAAPTLCYAQATFHGIGDLPGGPTLSVIRDATKAGGVIYAVGAGAANPQVLCTGPNTPPGCVPQFNTDTPVLWTWDGATATLTALPHLAPPNFPTPDTKVATAITPDGAFLASQARSNSTAPGEALAVRVTRIGLTNLNLCAAPFPTLSPPTMATTISDDGSILYGFSGAALRAYRFDVNTSSSVAIPLLPGSHTGNGPALGGSSSDGSVMVGTSFVAPFTGTNGRAFRYVHSNPVGTVAAVPLLAGGTWNRSVGVTSDGNVVLVAGDSTHLPNGEVYLYNATTGVTTPLGSPNTPWAPLSGGITADGSVVVATFGVPDSRHAYFRNAQGWFHLTTALAEQGINVFAEGWEAEGMQVTGISPDGTLVFGQGNHDDDLEGFVAEFPAGYLAGFDFPPVPPTDTSIVGVWTGPDVLGGAGLFLADGTFFLLDASHGSQPSGEFTSGFERARYRWDANTSAFGFATVQDTNGSIGFSGGNGIIGIPVTVSGDTLDLGGGAIVLTRVVGGAGSIVGGWVFGDPRVENSSAVLVFFANGIFLLAEDGDSALDPSGHDGIEAGTYTWNGSTLTVSVTVDTNGGWGFANGPGGGSVTLHLSPDELRLGPPGHPNQFIRIVDPQTVVPVITSPLAADGTVGFAFGYTIAAAYGASFGATGLPAGLSVNAATGVISGVPQQAGTFPVTISATNVFGGATSAALTVTVAPPPDRTRWYLAEGATGDFLDEILIGNPHDVPVDIRITWVLPAGTIPVAPLQFMMGPTSRTTVRVNDIQGLEATAVSAIVECTSEPARHIVVERSMYWHDLGQLKGHNSPGVTEPATTWYLAEGATGDFNDFVLIANPSATDTAEVEVTFLRDGGATVGPIHRSVSPGQRETIFVNVDVPPLAVASFSTRVESTNGVPVIVERAMYYPSTTGRFPGPVGHESTGVTGLSTRWVFGEGVTGGVLPNPIFDTFLLLANPGSSPADVRVIYAKSGGGRYEQHVTVAATSRSTTWVNLDIPGFSEAAFSMEVISDVPILAERAVYWGDGSPATWREAHNSPGATAEATAWAFAEGLDGTFGAAATPFQSYFLIGNTDTTTDLEFRVTFVREDGSGLVQDFTCPAGTRFTFASWMFPELNGHRFATFIESTNGLPFVAERAVYWGAGFVGGHASAGTPWSGAVATPPMVP